MISSNDPEQLPFLRAILSAPDDDLPRLVYADFLQEREDTVECPRCKGQGGLEDNLYTCPVCRPLEQPWKLGSGRVSNGFAARAEFIRIQCELAGIPDRCGNGWNTESGLGKVQCVCRWHVLRNRERELMPIIDAQLKESSWYRDLLLSGGRAFVRRGFIDEVRLPIARFFGGECERCGGGIVYIARTDIRVGQVLTTADASAECPSCVRGHTPAIGPVIAASQPVTRWVLTDREPHDLLVGRRMQHMWEWVRSGNNQYQLPTDLYLSLANYTDRQFDEAKMYPTRQDALDALSQACVRWTREQAKKLEHQLEEVR